MLRFFVFITEKLGEGQLKQNGDASVFLATAPGLDDAKFPVSLSSFLAYPDDGRERRPANRAFSSFEPRPVRTPTILSPLADSAGQLNASPTSSRSLPHICYQNFRPLAPFLPGTAQYVENDVTYSKQTTATFLTGATTACQPNQRSSRIAHSTALASPSITAEPSAAARPSLVTRHLSPTAPFLTGSASQTELPVTHSKQTTAPILTGARTAISDSAVQLPIDPPQEDKCPHRK